MGVQLCFRKGLLTAGLDREPSAWQQTTPVQNRGLTGLSTPVLSTAHSNMSLPPLSQCSARAPTVGVDWKDLGDARRQIPDCKGFQTYTGKQVLLYYLCAATTGSAQNPPKSISGLISQAHLLAHSGPVALLLSPECLLLRRPDCQPVD